MNQTKFEKLCRLFRLEPEARVVDIACGKGEFLVRLAELYAIHGVGVDISPYHISDCQEKKRRRVPEADIRFITMDGAEYTPDSPASFDVAMCIDASWIYGGYHGTLHALKKMTKLGGLIAVREPFWMHEPSDEYLTAEDMKKEDWRTHYDNVHIGEEEGFLCIYTLVSHHDD